jgi:3-oxoacyl-[acyl-carrier protein] reductase
MTMMIFSGQTALITGGRRGIGFAFAKALAERGARVVITTSGDPSAVDLEQLGPHALAVPWDMKDKSAALALMSALDEEKITNIGLFVHAAHIFAPHSLILATKPDDLASSLHHNVVAPFALVRQLARSMSRARFGRILFVSSLVASIGGTGQSQYIIEKSALEGMVRAFAAEFGSRDVLVNAIAPGIVDTENVRANVSEDIRKAFAERTNAGRLATPEEVALAGLPFLDPKQGFITGQTLRMTGGFGS